MKKIIINVIGPSASGKSTLVHALLNDSKENRVAEIVSDTSRELREYDNEVDGKDYYFRTREEMLEMVRNNEFAEFNDDYIGKDLYGIRKAEIEEKFINNDVLFVITDINGNNKLKELYPLNLITVFIMADEDIINERLLKRGDSPTSIEQKINKLKRSRELDNYRFADFIILNKNFNYALAQLKNVITIAS